MPFDDDSNTNVIMGFRADNIDSCKIEVTKFAKKDPRARFFFWSANPNPLDKSGSSNCYVFKSCTVKDRVSLVHPGDTYQLNARKFNYKLFRPHYIRNLIVFLV